MCFSAEVSFGSAAALVAGGTWCIRTAARRAPWAWPLAIVPCVFGIQQAVEGFVWVGLHQHSPATVALFAGVFLFFALAFWPIWCCVAVYLIEPDPRKRKFLFAWAMLSMAWLFVVFLPMIVEHGLPNAEIVGHSIHYDYWDIGGRWAEPMAIWLQRLMYVITISVPILTSSSRKLMLLPFTLCVLSAFAAMFLFDYAFTSVWCFWSALLSLWLVYMISRSPYELPVARSRYAGLSQPLG